MNDRSGIGLLEEAVALVRHAPARAWSWYLAGAIPFFAALLFFIRTTTGSLAVPDPGPGSLALALLFGWRQLSRSIYGRVLADEIAGTSRPSTTGVWLRAAVRTWFAGFLRIAVPLPVPYLSLLFRNYQAYAWDEETAFRRAADVSARGANPLVSWLALGAIGFCVWVNVLTGMLAAPVLYRMFTGEETILTLDIAAMFNRTVVVSSLMIAWCLCDAVLEGTYALRRFYGESEESGADLMRAWRRAAGVATKVAGVAILAFWIPAMHGQAPQPPADLNRAIDEVLAGQQYQWREAPAPQTGSDALIIRWIRSVAAGIRRGVRALLRPFRRWWDAFWRWLTGEASRRSDSGPGPPVDVLRFGAVLVSVVLAGALIALLLRARARRNLEAGHPSARPMPVDLADPDLTATDLAEEQWLKLAREWTQKGEPRMALRAWFLACLAWLNTRELVTISRHKSNLDYRRELARKARGVPGLTDEFAASVKVFEAAWYGTNSLDAAAVDRFAASVQRIRSFVQ
jgi:hypothetical protein